MCNRLAYLSLYTGPLFHHIHAIKSKDVFHTKRSRATKKNKRIKCFRFAFCRKTYFFPFWELRLSKHIKEHIYYNPFPSENYQLKIRVRASIISSQESSMCVHFPVLCLRACYYCCSSSNIEHTSRQCEVNKLFRLQ